MKPRKRRSALFAVEFALVAPAWGACVMLSCMYFYFRPDTCALGLIGCVGLWFGFMRVAGVHEGALATDAAILAALLPGFFAATRYLRGSWPDLDPFFGGSVVVLLAAGIQSLLVVGRSLGLRIATHRRGSLER